MFAVFSIRLTSGIYAQGTGQRTQALANHTVVSGKNQNEIATGETAYGLGFIKTNGSRSIRAFLESRR